MKIVNLLKKAMINLYSSLKRFPVAIALASVAAILLMILVENEQALNREAQDRLGRAAMVLALGIPISLCITIFSERKAGLNIFTKGALYLAEAAGLVFYYFYWLEDVNMVSVTRYIGLSLAFYLIFIIIPYFFRRSGFELHVIKLMTRFFITGLYSVVLFAGIAAILFTIEKLLEVKMSGTIYLDVWIGVVGIFAPSYFLAGVPLFSDKPEEGGYPKLLKVLLLYIVMPIASVYTVILYIYFAKILTTFQWPIGLVAHLVLWYAVICTIIVFFISPLFDENKWARTFIFLLPKIIIPLLAMMFFALMIRINAYGITENRYFVLLLGLWVLGSMVYLIFGGIRRNISLLIALSIISIIAVVGPLSGYTVAKFSQNQRFEGILEKYSMIKDNAIVKTEQTVADTDKREIVEILRYFSRSHSLSQVKYLPAGFEMNQVEAVFGFSEADISWDYSPTRYFSYGSNSQANFIDIKGYSYLFTTRGYKPAPESSAVGGELEMNYNETNYEVILKAGGKEIYRKSLLEYASQIHKKYGKENKNIVDASEMIFVDENQSVKVKIVINSIDGVEEPSPAGMKVHFIDFYLLVGLK